MSDRSSGLGNSVPTSPAALEQVAAWRAEVDGAVARVFRGDETASRIRAATLQLHTECARLAERGEGHQATIALVGEVGEGKTWIARCFLTDDPENDPVRGLLRSGQNPQDRTRELTWFGPHPPPRLEAGERHVSVPDSRMLDLGRPYVVGDTPGFTAGTESAGRLSSVAATRAAVKIVVLSAASLRDREVERLIAELDGGMILPVVRFRGQDPGADDPDPSLLEDVNRYLARWPPAAPHALLLDPLFVPDKDVHAGGEASVRRCVAERLRRSLAPRLAETHRLVEFVDQEIAQRRRVVETRVARMLVPLAQRVGPALEGLERRIADLPARLQDELVGDELLLRTAIRQRLRANWLEATPAWCFPYRSFLGLLVLTAGAWDRLIFSLAGSLPSLTMTVFQSVRNVRDAREVVARMQEGMAERLQRMVRDWVGHDYRMFRTALESARGAEEASADPIPDGAARIVGLDDLVDRSQAIVREAVDGQGPRRSLAWGVALVATAVFLALVFGPIVAIYGEFLEVAARVWVDVGQGQPVSDVSWKDFPAPSPSMLTASLILAAAPVFLIALVGLGWACAARRVRRAVARIRADHAETIARGSHEGTLRVELHDPLLQAARTLIALRRKTQGSPQDVEGIERSAR